MALNRCNGTRNWLGLAVIIILGWWRRYRQACAVDWSIWFCFVSHQIDSRNSIQSNQLHIVFSFSHAFYVKHIHSTSNIHWKSIFSIDSNDRIKLDITMNFINRHEWFWCCCFFFTRSPKKEANHSVFWCGEDSNEITKSEKIIENNLMRGLKFHVDCNDIELVQ